MADLEAIGDVATGALAGRAVEPAHGEGDGHTHEAACLNCGCALTGPYCHCCGQRAHVHRTLSAFFHDLLHGVLHFEGKTWRTLPLLAWKPGELTRRYVEGQRASFVSPIALFLFSVFLMFAVVSSTGNIDPGLDTISRDLATAEKQTVDKGAVLQRRREARIRQDKSVENVDADIRENQSDLEAIRELRRRGITEAVLNRRAALDTDVPILQEAYRKAKENPELLLYKLKSDSYKWSWMLIPLSVPFLWLLFPFSRRFRLYDHTVFVTYSLSFMTLLISLGTLLSWGGANIVAAPMLLIPPIHMYRQLRGAYGVGRFGALWRTVLLVISAILAISLFVMMILGMGIFE